MTAERGPRQWGRVLGPPPPLVRAEDAEAYVAWSLIVATAGRDWTPDFQSDAPGGVRRGPRLLAELDPEMMTKE